MQIVWLFALPFVTTLQAKTGAASDAHHEETHLKNTAHHRERHAREK